MYKKTLTKPDGRLLILYSSQPIRDEITATSPNASGAEAATPHMRWHPLRREWVIYASHRQNRTFLPPKNYSPLLPSTDKNFPTEMPVGDYDVAVFENLFPSMNLLTKEAPSLDVPTQPAKGICEVVVFTKNADASLGGLPLSQVKMVLEVWSDRTEEFKKNPTIHYVMPFENRGVEMGVTLHHPHGQIYAYSFIPPVQDLFLRSMKAHFEKTGTGLLEKMIQDEKATGERVLVETEHTIAFIPICARYPYETWIAPKRKVSHLSDLSSDEMLDLARVLKTMLLKFDSLWNKPFPYLMTLFQAPVDQREYPEAHLHFEIFPPLRSQDRLKYLAGTELGAGVFINDSLPEEKAAELRAVKVKFENE